MSFPLTAPPPTAGSVKRYLPPSIAGDYTLLTAKQTTLLGIAADLGANRFAKRASQIDRDAWVPTSPPT